jgi:3-oxoacyl-[acyl-carrier protein] reductase
MSQLKDKTAIVTGASQGIGEAIALDIGRLEGITVILADVQREKCEEVAQSIIKTGGSAEAYQVDVCSSEQVTAVVDDVIKKHGAVHYLINNAGITRDNLLMRMKKEEWDAVLRVNLDGVYLFSRAVIRNMLSNRFGRIVNMASVVGLMGNAGQTNYSASKAAVVGFTKSLAREVASRGITVNAVAPGYIASPMTDKLSDAVKSAFLDFIPMKRFGTPEEVANLVRFILSEDAAYITGHVFSINGGMYM